MQNNHLRLGPGLHDLHDIFCMTYLSIVVGLDIGYLHAKFQANPCKTQAVIVIRLGP